MTYIYISKPRPDRGIYKVEWNDNGVLNCTKNGEGNYLFDETQAEPVTFHHFLSERYLLLENKEMKVNLTVEELCNFVEEWEKFNLENK
jgi:hypothetical protein